MPALLVFFFGVTKGLAFVFLYESRGSIACIAEIEPDGIDAVTSRATYPDIAIVWERHSGTAADRIARRGPGKDYDRASSQRSAIAMVDVVVPLERVHPVAGEDWNLSWKACARRELGFSVRGEKGEGIIQLRGYDRSKTELLVEGERITRLRAKDPL